MVGHSGKIDASIKAVSTIDTCVGIILDELFKLNGKAIITSDHGNIEELLDKDGNPHTAHTLNRVPFILIDPNFHGKIRTNGALKDVVPTILGILNIKKPKEMTGEDLRIKL
jgi:2,3-bisphosphoglycerate-independent phosphoglycerate mutase